MGYEKALSFAVHAQFWGVTLAGFGCFGIFYRTSPDWMSRKMIVGVVIPFAIAYGLFGIGFVFFDKYEDEAVCKKIYTWFVPLCLCANAVSLSIMVAASGGLKQSLFTPLFLALPAVAVVLVPRSWLEVSHIPMVTFITLLIVGYLVVYWRFSPIPARAPGLFYGIWENLTLAGSVFLTAYMSLKVPTLQ